MVAAPAFDRTVSPMPAIDSGILLTGLTFNGMPVTRVVIEWDGGRMESALPTADGMDAAATRILDKLASSPVPVTRKQLARMLGLKGIGGRFSQDVGGLVESGRVVERSGLLTDDATKFDDGG